MGDNLPNLVTPFASYIQNARKYASSLQFVTQYMVGWVRIPAAFNRLGGFFRTVTLNVKGNNRKQKTLRKTKGRNVKYPSLRLNRLLEKQLRERIQTYVKKE
jgi:hypothetical protein